MIVFVSLCVRVCLSVNVVFESYLFAENCLECPSVHEHSTPQTCPPPPLLFFLLNRMNSLSNIYPATLVFSCQFSLFLADLTQPVPLRVCNPTMHHTLTHLYIYPLFFFSNDGWTYVFCCSANVSASASISCRSDASTRYGSITEFLSVLVLFSRSFFLDEKNHKSVLAQVLTLPS